MFLNIRETDIVKITTGHPYFCYIRQMSGIPSSAHSLRMSSGQMLA